MVKLIFEFEFDFFEKQMLRHTLHLVPKNLIPKKGTITNH
jgi:hypothetical protein